MHFVRKLLIFLLLSCCVYPSWAQQSQKTYVFVRLAEALPSDVRKAKYESPLDQDLQRLHLGEVSGGGDALTKDGRVLWSGLDIELNDVPKGIPFLRKRLVELGAPDGSQLDYKFKGKSLEVSLHR